MVRTGRSTIGLFLPLVATITLICPARARAERVDINDPTLLGPVISRTGNGGSDYQNLKSEVRFREGIYPYIYAVDGSGRVDSNARGIKASR